MTNYEWIPISTMPDDDKEYIVCNNEGTITTLVWNTKYNIWDESPFVWHRVNGEITHWMNLPLPPNQ